MSIDSQVIEPGSRIGVFGGGQLGRMFAHSAQRMGYQVIVYSPEENGPASQVVGDSILADYMDLDRVRCFAQSVDVITLEFENIPLLAVEEASRWAAVRPGGNVLSVAQHRLIEKTTLGKHGFPVTPFSEVNASNLESVAKELGFPMIIKTSTLGYDGKGQCKVGSLEEAKAAIHQLGSGDKIAEKMIDFQCEVSILVARNANGDIKTYPLFFNEHANHILDVTQCPIPSEIRNAEAKGVEIGRGVATALQLEGLLCIEFFVDQSGEVMINEIAPRPHNSGHLTIEACWTSQFEQQVRAVCNLPLGDTGLIRPAAMANLLGDVWEHGSPRYAEVLRNSGAYLHFYGKAEAKVGRKMGHLTCLADSAMGATLNARRLRGILKRAK